MVLLILMLALNLVVSWFNCYSVGGIWAESKTLGGFPRVLAWCGAIQSAIGFSSVIGFVLGALAYQAGYLPPKVATGAVSLWYLLIIVPAIGTGLIITVQSWIVAFRERSLLNMGVAAYNTAAQVHNMYSAVGGIGEALKGVGDLFNSDDDDAPSLVLLAIALVACALAGGILLTAALIKHYSGRLPLPERGAVPA